MKSKFRNVLYALSAVVLSINLNADVELPSVIGSNMVLQAGEPLNFWGWADVGEKVAIKQSGVVLGAADGQGKEKAWRIQLPAQKPGPVADIEVSGKNTIVLTNILAGEVWLCSGQSNMVQTLKNGQWCKWGGVLDADKEVAAATDGQIRFYVESSPASGKPQARPMGSWRVCSPETSPEISGVGYFFARKIRGELKVPAGLIVSAVGGTPAEQWTPIRNLEGNTEYRELMASLGEVNKEFGPRYADEQKLLNEWNKQVIAAKAKNEAPPPKPQLVVPQEKASLIQNFKLMSGCGGLYNGKIHPLAPFNIRGAIWYQGEANANRPEYYAMLMSSLIQGWREDWGSQFPFIIVALSGYGNPEPWTDNPGSFPLIREAQLKVADKIPACGVISAVDVGDARNIHARNKQAVGLRAALWALKNVYGKPVAGAGPRLENVKFSEGKAIVSLTGEKEGLTLKSPGGFELAGENRKFVPAKAELKGDAIEVSAPGVDKPVALRYDFMNFPESTVYNGAGLPALPFRTDDWPVKNSLAEGAAK